MSAHTPGTPVTDDGDERVLGHLCLLGALASHHGRRDRRGWVLCPNRPLPCAGGSPDTPIKRSGSAVRPGTWERGQEHVPKIRFRPFAAAEGMDIAVVEGTSAGAAG